MQESQKILLTGIQPTGSLHLGNLLGSINNAKKMTDLFHRRYFMVADLHSLTAPWEIDKIKQHSYEVLANYLAAGLDSEDSIFFLQSQNLDHSALAWLLATQTSFGKLKHMIQFKEKAAKTDDANLALFSYPVLMAADILLYDTTDVPVGDDQDQHLELTRDLASKINDKFGDLLTIPRAYHSNKLSRIKSLQNPAEKMSKSSADDMGRINIFDSKDKVRYKIMKAVTDEKGEVNYDEMAQPGVSNLLNIYSQITDRAVSEIVDQYQNQGYAVFKKDLADIVVDFISVHQEKLLALLENRDYLNKVLKQGLEKSKQQSTAKLIKLNQAFGI